MKTKHIKLRPLRASPRCFNDENYQTKNSFFSKPRSPEFTPSDFDQSQQVLDVLKEMVNTLKASKIQPTQSVRQDVEPRDRQVLLDPYDFFENGTISQKNLKKWSSEVFKMVFSTTFNYFSKNQMNFDQAKIFCSENIFKNFVLLNQKYSLNAAEVELLDNYIEKKVLHYIGKKYPLTYSTEVNKKLEELVYEVDNIEALSNNYLISSKVVFEYRDDGNYNDLIMRFINEVKDRIDLENNSEDTNYEDFQQYMRNLFQKVSDHDWMNSSDIKNEESAEEALEKKILNAESTESQKQVMKAMVNIMKKQQNQKEDFKAEVKEYTNYSIGRKIPENTPNFTEKQIANRNITMKSTTILRLLTKWCTQLWQKYEQIGYFTSRSESVKDLKGGNINTLLSWMRKWIDKRLQQQKEEIVKFMDDLCDNNYEMQSKIMQIEINGEDGAEYIDDEEKISGKFCSKVVKNLHSYIIAYLNRLIHGLLKVAKQFHEENELSTHSFWPSPPNLLSFKLGDLMRCKCSSKERQIIRIYKQIERISKQNPNKFKIVRIKNRLQSGTNDILINIKFNNSILCQIQLAINNHTSDFIKCSNLFQHYIYELQRSTFGPLTELCSIWNTLDQRTVIYDELIEEEYLRFEKKEHKCPNMCMKIEMVRFSKSFICSGCNHTFFHNNYLRKHMKCKNCDYYICSNCQISTRQEKTLIEDMIKDDTIKKYVKKRITKDQNLPEFGFCIFLERKSPKIELFQYVKFQRNKKDYLFGKKEGKIYEIDKIKTEKEMFDFRNKHLIFQIDKGYKDQEKLSKKEINKFIMTQLMKQSYKKQKESISLMGQSLNTKECRQILSVGAMYQKQNVKNLFLADNQLTQLPFDPKDFPQLYWLTLSRNTFTSFDEFNRFVCLKNLIWNAGSIKEIPTSIYNLSTLKELSLSKNELTYLSPDVSRLRNLKGLKLDGNMLEELPEEIGECRFLTSLNLEGNKLTKLPSTLFQLDRMEELLLNSNILTQIPDELCELKKLKQFNISKNTEVSKFPKTFTSLEYLETLDCSSTKIQNLPDEIHKLKKLQSLNIENTLINKLPDDFSELLSLETLIMADLKNLSIRNEIGELYNLKKLNISGCFIDKLPNFKHLEKLQTLDISRNYFDTIDDQVFGQMNSLTKLIASENKFETFPIIKKLERLTSLDLSKNQIKVIPGYISKNLNLEQFIMKHNQISELPLGFRQLVRLSRMDLQGNGMEVLFNLNDQEQINNMELPVWPYLSYLNLTDNKFKDLPSYVYKCQKIEELILTHNLIEKFSPDLQKLKILWSLKADQNMLEQIPEELACHETLAKVDLSLNQIHHVSNIIQSWPELMILNVDNCPINEIECIDWILNNSKTIDFGNLVDMSKKLKFRVIRATRASLSRDKDLDTETAQGQVRSELYVKKVGGYRSQHIIEK